MATFTMQMWLFCLYFLQTSSSEVIDFVDFAEKSVKTREEEKNDDVSSRQFGPVSHLDLFQQKPKPLRQDLSTLPTVMSADKISSSLRDIANGEMRVREMQGLFDKLPFKRVKIDRSAILNQLASEMDESLFRYLKVLSASRDEVSAYHEKNPVDVRVLRSFRGCCSMEKRDLQYEGQFSAWVNTSYSCDIVPPELPKFLFYPGQMLTEVYKQNVRKVPGIRWQYFISPEGSHIEYPAHGSGVSRCLQIEALRHRAQFMATALPYPKQVVILIEYGSSLFDSQLGKAKAIAKLLLESFSRQDLVTVLAVSDDISRPCGDQMLNATWEAKDVLKNFVDRLMKQTKQTNHSLGFAEAYRILAKTANARNIANDTRTVHPYIFYVSRGLLSSLTEAGDVLSTLAELNLNTGLSVQINTLAVLDEGKLPVWETQFLKDVAEQNFEKHDHRMSSVLKEALASKKIIPPTGKMVIVSGTARKTLTLRAVFSMLKKPEANLETSYRDLLSWSEPRVDPVAQPENGYEGPETLADQLGRSVISLSLPVWEEEKFVGIVGQDLSLGSLTARLRYFSRQEPGSYVFLIDKQGMTVWHPKLENGIPWVSTVDEVEEANLWEQIAENGGNSWVFNNKKYRWVKLENAPYTLVHAAKATKDEDFAQLDSFQPKIRDLVYHRLDLQLNNNIKKHCLNQDQLSTTELGSVYLAPECFRFPYRHLVTRGETKMIAANYWAHLSDLTKLIKNPGLKPGVKADISALAGIVADWKKDFKDSKYRKNVLRKFAATHSGVMVSYPAGLLDSEYEPTKRNWYRSALTFPGHVVVSAPYLDPSGAGYTVTLSHTVYEGKRSALHHPTDKVVAVVGMDVPLSFLYKVLMESLPVCRKNGMRCILLENKGYLVGHGWPDSRSQPPISDREPLEGHHLTHKEPILAGDLLQHELLVKKFLCKRLGDRTLQRMYTFNTSYTNVLKDKESVGCTRFQLTHVPMTNTFLVILNHTCNQGQGASFCPCSVTDRRCLNCYRSDSTECECPCECSLSPPPWFEKACPHHRSSSENSAGKSPLESAENYAYSGLPTCEIPQPPFRIPKLNPLVLANLISRNGADIRRNDARASENYGTTGGLLPQCLPIKCEDYSEGGEMGCLGLVGCQWCMKEEDGRTDLEMPHCAGISSCFGGVRGRTPDGQTQYPDDYLAVSTPVGPVAGGIMAIFVFLVVGVYCYRHQMTRMVEARAGSGARLHLTGCDGDEEEFQFDHDGSKPVGSNGMVNTSQSGVSQVLLASFEREVPQANPANYRRGPRTESSDHGYSTMTGNCDDSEQATVVGELITPKPRLGLNKTTLTGLGTFGPSPTKRHSDQNYAMSPNDKHSAGSLTKLLIKDGNLNNTSTTTMIDGNCDAELTKINNKRMSRDNDTSSPPPGQTIIGLDDSMIVRSTDEPDSNLVTIKAQVHAIDTQG